MGVPRLTEGALAREWDASTYHRVSTPQVEWGTAVVARVDPSGVRRALDIGCGTGRLTTKLAERLPGAQIVALDRSLAMARAAHDHLGAPATEHRAAGVVVGDALALPLTSESMDLIFSTATFHWVLDHDGLARELYRVLRPGGRVVAQCGGIGNIARIHAFAEEVLQEPGLREHVAQWRRPWHFAGAEDTAGRLAAAGFIDVRTKVFDAPVSFSSEVDFRAFLVTVILREHLAALPDGVTRSRLVDGVCARAAESTPPWSLDYTRLDIDATRPARAL